MVALRIRRPGRARRMQQKETYAEWKKQ